ncbi:MAG: endo-1,4-beta-xylanase [Spirochaetales bacterium]|nr:endo-1,4-beta-xylanase [Spirochaetales bacterium]
MNNQEFSLSQKYKDYFPIGAAVNRKTITSHQELLLRHFNSITLESEMKFELLHPAENTYTFSTADMIIDIAKKHNMKVRGHTLVWHRQTSEWVFLDRNGELVSREVLLERIEEHINRVMSRYKNDVYSWDVVNEAIAEGTDYLRDSKWLTIIGKDYVEKIFTYAHRADPKAQLFYNDYDVVIPEKRDKIIRLIRELKQKEVPVHGIGLQGHWNIYFPSIDLIKEAFDKYAELGLPLQITELDVSMYEFHDKSKMDKPSPEMYEKQTIFYEKIFALFREYRDIITGVTVWGIADDKTWLDNFPVRDRKNWPLLFDTSHQPKEAFHKIMDF